MTSIKLLIISFTMTFLTLITIAPALAAPSVKIQHLQVSKMHPIAHTSYDSIAITDKETPEFSKQYGNNFSTGLILSSSGMLTKENAQVAMKVVNKSNDFFASAMIVSDRLNQLFSYFATPATKNITEQIAPEKEHKVIKKKCSSTTNYS